MTTETASLIINSQGLLSGHQEYLFVLNSKRISFSRLTSFKFQNTLLCPSPQVKPSYKTVPNGKITTSARQKPAGLSKKSSAEEKERGKEKEEKSERKEEKNDEETSEESRAEEQAFLVALYKYMKERDTPIERIPFLGFKQSE